MIPLGDGFASDAWLVTAADGDRAVLRIDRGLVSVTYPMEHALMARLAALGAAVPHPIVGSWEVPGCTRPAFSLTSWAIGLCFGAYRWHLSRQHEFDDDEHDRAYLETCLHQRPLPSRS